MIRTVLFAVLATLALSACVVDSDNIVHFADGSLSPYSSPAGAAVDGIGDGSN